jgi:hypothetical protein
MTSFLRGEDNAPGAGGSQLIRREEGVFSGSAAYPQQQAVLWALRELTGKDAGERAEDWHRALTRDTIGIRW